MNFKVRSLRTQHFAERLLLLGTRVAHLLELRKESCADQPAVLSEVRSGRQQS
jgi:hypothetical protein